MLPLLSAVKPECGPRSILPWPVLTNRTLYMYTADDSDLISISLGGKAAHVRLLKTSSQSNLPDFISRRNDFTHNLDLALTLLAGRYRIVPFQVGNRALLPYIYDLPQPWKPGLEGLQICRRRGGLGLFIAPFFFNSFLP